VIITICYARSIVFNIKLQTIKNFEIISYILRTKSSSNSSSSSACSKAEGG
jgi:hypothetical protein